MGWNEYKDLWHHLLNKIVDAAEAVLGKDPPLEFEELQLEGPLWMSFGCL